ncbi:MAG TPA: serine hydrolase [Pelagibacterium sp.]|uniref:serine hydrolase domain-containing protein n=1 Tax=Pelagibacterium sp. TaxID=1967288 RepID=UPI002D18AA81|nr:serine hydrolase [Pelagibacterium sp.]HWJ88875.1 serine hydrolase [Pelagibacterium sp.]
MRTPTSYLVAALFTAIGTLPIAPILALESSRLHEIEAILDTAETITPLETVIVSLDGEIIAQRGFHGHSVSEPTNIKSASKPIIGAMVGIAIDKGLLEGPDQPIASLLSDAFPPDPDPRLDAITVGHLLSMQAGLEGTSGDNYGRWVASDDWVRSALALPFADDPGGAMIYSTGSTHLLSAILTRVGGASTLDLARDWFVDLDGFAIAGWLQDPQGLYLGGNEMAMTPLSLLAFGELIRNGGKTGDGQQIVPGDWIETSFEPRTTSRLTHGPYGYGWFLGNFGGEEFAYGWGYGGQMLYVARAAGLTVVMTSDPTSPSDGNGHRERLNALLADIVKAVSPPVSGAADL